MGLVEVINKDDGHLGGFREQTGRGTRASTGDRSSEASPDATTDARRFSPTLQGSPK